MRESAASAMRPTVFAPASLHWKTSAHYADFAENPQNDFFRSTKTIIFVYIACRSLLSGIRQTKTLSEDLFFVALAYLHTLAVEPVRTVSRLHRLNKQRRSFYSAALRAFCAPFTRRFFRFFCKICLLCHRLLHSFLIYSNYIAARFDGSA